jgi:hypothetical protein
VERLDLAVTVDVPPERFPAEIEASAYFIVAEALTNIVKVDVRARGNPNGPYLPQWPEFNPSHQFMSLKACDTAESSNEPPAACSQTLAIASLVAAHKLDLWASILS